MKAWNDPTPILMQTKELDCSMAGKQGGRMERKYQKLYPQSLVPLKAKYRIDRDAHAQWGTGGDHTGKAKIQGKAKPQVIRNRVMVVDGLTGHKIMVDA